MAVEREGWIDRDADCHLPLPRVLYCKQSWAAIGVKRNIRWQDM